MGLLTAVPPGRPYAHARQLVWSKLDDAGIVPGVNLDVVKVKAHISQAARGKLGQPQAWQLQGNAAADKWANAGAYGAGLLAGLFLRL